MTCARPGSLGRHVLGDPDWVGRRTCACGRVRWLPPHTHGLPARDPLEELVDRLLAPGVMTLEEFAADLGLTVDQVDTVHLIEESPAP